MSQRIVFSILMSFVLSFLMTLWVTWLNLGLTPTFLADWMTAFRSAWPAAAFISFTLAPPVLRLSQRLTRPRVQA